MPAVEVDTSFVSNEHFSLQAKMMEKVPELTKTAAMYRPPPAEFSTALGNLLNEYEFGDEPAEVVLRELESLVLAFVPRQFQYAGDTFDSRHVFVGPCLTDRGERWEPPPGGRPVLLVSLGSAS